MQLRDYQVEATANVYSVFGVHPAGPSDEPVVQQYRKIGPDGGSDWVGKDRDDVGTCDDVANRSGDDDITSF